MKLLFVRAKANSFSFDKFKINTNILPQTLALVTTIQFVDILPKLKSYLEKQGKKVLVQKNGQIVGCNTINAKAVENKVQAFLYIGSGKFHPLALALSLKQQKPIFIYNPFTEEFSKLEEKEISKVIAKKKTAKIKFLSADTFGILVSTKPGQNRLKKAEELKKILEKQGKKCYIFLFNDLDINQLENWPQIECWINSACPGLSLENAFIWIDEIMQNKHNNRNKIITK